MQVSSVSQPLELMRVAPSAAAERRPDPVPQAPAEIERRLVERAQAGDEAAFGALYQRHVDNVYGYVRLQVRDASLAQDLTQDVFVNAFRGLAGFEWQGSLAPWLTRIAQNVVANHWRRQRRQPAWTRLPGEDDPDETLPEIAVPDEALERFVLDVSTEQILDAMAKLTELQQQVIALRFGAGLPLLETAEMMGRSVAAVKNLQFKALGALRRQLEPGEAPA